MSTYEFTDGKTLPFKSLGYALEYAHKHNLKLVRVY